jgi:hypothetical protein
MARCEECGEDFSELNIAAGKFFVCDACLPAFPSVCDFCRKPERVWFYPAAEYGFVDYPWDPWVEFGLRPAPFISIGTGWDACATCHALIEDKEYERLARRAQNHPGNDVELRFMLTFFKVFFFARLGPAERIE